jgi:hypothetical protein
MPPVFSLTGSRRRSLGLFGFMFVAAAQAPCARTPLPPPGPAPDSVRLARELWLAPDASMRSAQEPAQAPGVSQPEEAAQFSDGGVELSLDVWMPFRGLPEVLRPQSTEESAPAIAESLPLDPPHSYELVYRVHAPEGFVAEKLPEAEQLKIGPALLSVDYQTEPDTTVKATVRFQVGKAAYSREEVLAFRQTYLEKGAALAPVLRFVPAAKTAAGGSVSRFEDLGGDKKLTDLSPSEFESACTWTNDLARAKLPAEGTSIECDGQKIPFAWPSRCAIGGGRPRSGCAVTVAQTRQCMPAFLDQIKRDPCAFFLVASLGEAKDLLAKVPECSGTPACVFSP